MKAFKDAVMAPAGAPKLKKGAYPTNEAAVKAAGTAARCAGPASTGQEDCSHRSLARQGGQAPLRLLSIPLT